MKRPIIIQPVFPDGRRKAITLSYDDGVIQDRRFVKLLAEYDVKCTFNIGSGLLGTEQISHFEGRTVDTSKVASSEVKSLYAGHEVAAHGLYHHSLPAIGGDAAYEVAADRHNLEELSGYSVRGFAYPFGMFSDDVKQLLRLSGIAYARTVQSTYSFALPDDAYQWNPTCHHNDAQLMELARRFCEEDRRFAGMELFYLWGHAYEFDGDNNWETIEAFLKYVSAFSQSIWFATNIDIMDYLYAQKQLRYSHGGTHIYNPTALRLWIAYFSDNGIQTACIEAGCEQVIA